jgi:hypothetical protein
MDRITFLLYVNRKAGRKLRKQQDQDKAKAEQARLEEIADTQRKHAEEAVDMS